VLSITINNLQEKISLIDFSNDSIKLVFIFLYPKEPRNDVDSSSNQGKKVELS